MPDINPTNDSSKGFEPIDPAPVTDGADKIQPEYVPAENPTK